MRRVVLAVSVCLLPCTAATPVWSQPSSGNDAPWPQFLGGGSNLTIDVPELDRSRGVPAIEMRWRRPLGPGYSQPVVAGDTAYVAFSDGERDRLAALSLRSGEERWDYAIGETWRGVDGSDDGPISTPALADGVVVGLGPRGQLFALNAKTGEQLWRVDLPTAHGASSANYGVATSPLIVDGVVIVQVGGGEGRSVGAFDLGSGKLVWSTGDDPVEYQSPVVATLLDVRQLLAVTATEISGLDLDEGALLWTESYLDKGQNRSSPVVVTSDDSFIVLAGDETIAFELDRNGDRFFARERWRSRELKRTYSYPIALEGVLYGWNGEFFASIDAQTGRRNWKTRGVGPGGLISLGDWLVIWTVDGRLLLVEPVPTEYRQVAAHQLVEMGTLVNPAWTGDGLLLRGRDELLMVEVGIATSSRETPKITALDTAPASGRLGSLLQSLADTSEEHVDRLIETFLSENQIPVVEPDGTVTFLYYGETDDVGLVLGWVPVESSLPMTRVSKTALWFRTEELNRRGAYAYRFELAGERSPDPRNENRAASPFPVSLLLMPDYRPPPSLLPDAPVPPTKGALESHRFHSKIMDNERTVAVYTPPGYDGKERYPLVAITSGMDRLFGRTTEILDAAMGTTVEPAVVVFVDVGEPLDMNIFYESLGSRGPLYSRMLIEEILPFIERTYSVSSEPGRRLIMGNTLLGSRALDIALRHPEVFGGVAVQSPTLNGAFERELARVIESASERPEVYIDWCERDSVALAEATVVKPAVERLVPAMRAAGIEVTTKELPGGYSWEMWSTQTEAILSQFLPMDPGPP